MRGNLLKLNDEKTEFMIIGTRQQLRKVGKLMIEIGQDTIANTPSARNLGFTMMKSSKTQLISTTYAVD